MKKPTVSTILKEAIATAKEKVKRCEEIGLPDLTNIKTARYEELVILQKKLKAAKLI